MVRLLPFSANSRFLTVLNPSDYLVNVTSLEQERWKREHPEICRRMGIR